ncbi:MAG: sulfotransferase family 2 domain-containing protein [Bacteroidota bacterium]
MIISHKKKFIFIHIYKVAGTSIRKALDPFNDMSAADFPWYQNIIFWLGARYNIFSQHSMNHIKAAHLKQLLPGKIYNEYFKFSFVRNPWDWQVSLYHFMIQNTKHPQHHIIKKMKNFDEYIDWVVKNEHSLQKDFLYDKEGNLIVDYIGKFENLQEDFKEICLRLEIEPVALPLTNKSSHSHYRDYYSNESRDKIYETFKEDIEYFHYKF